jgi:hypothetical protein
MRRLFIKHAKLGGTPPNPPFDMVASARLGGPFGPSVTLLVPVESLDLTLWPGTTRVAVALGFSSASLTGTGLTVNGLAGTIDIGTAIDTVSEPFLLIRSGAIRVDLGGADAALQLERDSAQRLEEAVAAAGIASTAGDVTQVLSDACQAVVRGSRSPVLPQAKGVAGIPIDPSTDGSLGDPHGLLYKGPRLVSLDAVICPTPDSLAVFATLLTDSPGGSPTQKTGTCLSAGADLAIGLSSEVFRRLSFCPGAIKSLRKPDLDDEREDVLRYDASTQMPGCCGSAEEIEYKGLAIADLCAHLVDPSAGPGSASSPGHIEVTGSYRKSGFCYDAHGSFAQRLDLVVDGAGGLRADSSQPSHTMHLSAPFYCPTALPFLLGEGSSMVREVNERVILGIEIVAEALGAKVPAATLAVPSPRPVVFNVFEGATPLAVETFAEGIVVNAAWSMDLPQAMTRTLQLAGQVERTEDPQPGASSTYVVPDGGLCSGGSYPWTEFTVALEGAYELQLGGWEEPVEVEWWLEHLRGAWGYNQQPQVTSSALLDPASGPHWAGLLGDLYFDAPPPRGPTLVDHPLLIPYEIGDRSIVVSSSQFSKGNYDLSLRVRVSDSSGASMETTTALPFHGEWVEIGGGYADHVKECIDRLRGWARRLGTIPQVVPHGGDPGPEGLVAILAVARALGGPEAARVEQEARTLGVTAFGSAFREAAMRSGVGLGA